MQFLVVAHDGRDAGALERRMKVREAHLEGIRKLKQSGNCLLGGALLDEAGRMVGSAVFVDFASREELDEWLRNDPYVTGDVWPDITVQAVKLGSREP